MTPIHNDALTPAQKLEVLVGQATAATHTYVFSVPPVTHANWSNFDWVRWIDGCNGWRKR